MLSQQFVTVCVNLMVFCVAACVVVPTLVVMWVCACAVVMHLEMKRRYIRAMISDYSKVRSAVRRAHREDAQCQQTINK